MARDPGSRTGQTMTETVILLPLFLVIVFGLLQLGQLGIAVIMVNYAASSIAREAASKFDYAGATNGVMQLHQKMQDLMVAGMSTDSSFGLLGCTVADTNTPTAELVVLVRAKVAAWPGLGYFLNGAFGDRYATQPLTCSDLTNAQGFGPFNYSTQPPTYFVTGTGKVRLNYKT
jgi:hypothetical protein